MMNKLIQILLVLLISCSAMSEDVYWVLDSFESEDLARVEGVRIAEESGLDVMLYETDVGTRHRYQLLALSLDEAGAKTVFSQRLIRAGVNEARPVQFEEGVPYMDIIFANRAMDNPLSATELAEINAMLAGLDDRDEENNGMLLSSIGPWIEKEGHEAKARTVSSVSGDYIVAGSFRSWKKAKRFTDEIGKKAPEISFYDIGVRSAQVSTEKFYRVVIGPIKPGQNQKVINAMRRYGIEDVWVLPGLGVSTESNLQNETRRITEGAIQSMPDLKASSQFQLEKNINRSAVPNADEDFNPILLRKISPQFPDPRNRR